ncbi:MAG: 2-amino-4-hydroxy-6-hydroxymethyldihydropteridine diphosphokinase [Nitriliruptor sp.]|uniref:2-amino-4-hydroxy-6- hydroxymethyldihydropteridine diphosphokinase n=1 Tax=Nitriliruptor sp. TaxID=2448056 RepID=UPI0034A06818
MADLTFLSLGANVGDALETLTAAVYALDDVDGFAVEDVSAVYETEPWPTPDDPRHVPQDPYLNLVVRGRTALDPHDLLRQTQLLEAAFGRDRATEQRWGPRPLDIDLLLVGDVRLATADLELPHPRLTERAFVLVPLAEVWPGGTLPDGQRVAQALAAIAPITGIELVVRLDDVPGRHVARPEGPGAPRASFERPGLDPDEAAGS